MHNPLESQQAAPAPSSLTLTPLMNGLVRLLKSQHAPVWHGHKVHVPEIASGAYFFYEQIRNAVEYRERHLFLRGAIERFLLRELRPGQTDAIGLELVRELTKTRYLPNDSVHHDQIEYMDYVAQRYATLQRMIGAHRNNQELVATSIVQLLSVELERALMPNPSEAAIVEFTYASFLEHADIAKADQMGLYAAVHRALVKSDIATIRYGVFSRAFPRWLEDDAQLENAANRFLELNGQLADQLQGARPHRIFRLVRRNIAPYLILREIIKTSHEGLDEIASRSTVLMEKARAVAEQQYQVVTGRLRRSIIQAVIFLFVTKVILGMLIEIPYEIFAYGSLNYLPLGINLLFPPTYMAIVGSTIKVPGQRNTTKIMADLKQIVYETDQEPLRYTLRRQGRAGRVGKAFNTFYGLTSLVTLVALAYGLHTIGFNVVSGVIFFVFLSTVSFFAYRISYSVREYAVIEEDPGFFATLSDFLLTPFIRTGQWLSERYSRINIMTAILDIIIETPFKTVLRIIEQWNSFLRDKRDDVLR
ncbi:MAG TPA: hypothetical protein VHQ86_00895 [Candidatus Saccharimonadia bacterium]|jgi:hypothetical protein|nr:hypothetical protein [Candidatus Saccharimonadia bacterium]